MISVTLVAMLIMLSWLRVARPGGTRLEGRIISDAPMPLLARLRMHAFVGGGVLLASVALLLFRDLPWWGVVAAFGSTAALVATPIRYTLTTLGIRSGWTRFRRWTEFAGVSRARGGARLQCAAGMRDKRIWLSGSRGDDEFVAMLRRMIKGAYKGQNLLLDYPPRATGEAPGNQAAASKISRTSA
jgi:hypothetical protein